MCELSPYPWNPWIELKGVLACQFCGSLYDFGQPINAHKEDCGWKNRWIQVHGHNLCGRESMSRSANKQLLQENS